MLRRLTVCLVVALAGFAAAQSSKTIKLSFAAEGDREVWMQSKANLATVPETKKVNGKALDLTTTATDADLAVVVCDVATGGVAAKLVSDIKNGEWKVTGTDYTLVRGAKVTVTTEKGMVASAVIDMTLGTEKRQVLLSPSDKGVVSINVLPVGDAVFTAKYKAGGAEKTLDAQTFSIKPTAGGWVPVKLVVPEGADLLPVETPKPTASDAKPTTTDEKPKEEPKKEGGPFAVLGLLVNMLIGLGLVAALGYGAWWYIKNNREKVTEIMDKAGVPLNQNPADPTGAAPVIPQAPKPIEKIVLGDADPGVAAPVAAAAVATKNPRLVGADGSVVQLEAGTLQVGREPGLAVSLPSESSVSRHHASLSRAGDSVTLVDEGSTNGTYVNGAKITTPTVLQPGDSVQFGAVAYRYEE